MAIERETTHREPKRMKRTHETPTSSDPSHPLPNLPHEIIAEILSRLPVKPLLQFRSVCKSWCSLISSDQFVKTHLILASNGGDFTRQRLILNSVHPHFHLSSCSLYSVFHDQFVNVAELDYPLKDYPLKDPLKLVWIMGSCNGLVCVAIGVDSIFLWNPSTRKSKRLLESGVRLRNGYKVCGFGYDEYNDDYKMVVIFCLLGKNGGSCQTQVKVYTLRTDSWRSIGDFSYGIPLDKSEFVNGSLHWAVSGDTGSSHTWAIVSLDLAKEAYGELAQPNYGGGTGSIDLGLWVLKGCLCVLCNFLGAHTDVWVMEEYGKTESWTKLFVIPCLTDPGRYEYTKPLCISKSGEILLQFGQRLVLYNPKNDTFRNPTSQNLHACLIGHSYVESLVSPSTENVVQRYN